MATLSPLAIALQGLGFAPALIALQGFIAAVDEAIKEIERQALTAAAPRTRMRITPTVLPYPQAKPQHRTRAQREKEFPVIAA